MYYRFADDIPAWQIELLKLAGRQDDKLKRSAQCVNRLRQNSIDDNPCQGTLVFATALRLILAVHVFLKRDTRDSLGWLTMNLYSLY